MNREGGFHKMKENNDKERKRIGNKKKCKG
jgi:hypothetical protein